MHKDNYGGIMLTRGPNFVHASESPTKVAAVRAGIDVHYPFGYTLTHVAGDSGFGRQPIGHRETIAAAKQRAQNAYAVPPKHDLYDLAIALESGLIELPGSRSGLMECCVCVLYNGAAYALGQSAGFEIPVPVASIILEEKCSISLAFKRLGIIARDTAHGKSGITEFLTCSRISRQAQNEQALTMALAQLDHHELYGIEWRFARP